MSGNDDICHKSNKRGVGIKIFQGMLSESNFLEAEPSSLAPTPRVLAGWSVWMSAVRMRKIKPQPDLGTDGQALTDCSGAGVEFFHAVGQENDFLFTAHSVCLLSPCVHLTSEEECLLIAKVTPR